MQKRKLLVLAILLSLAQLSIAQAISADTVLNLIKTGMAPAVSKLTSTAISWLGVFAVIQFVITNYGLLKNDGDLQAVIAKATAALTWVGVCLYIINNGPDFIQAVGDEMMGIVGFDLPSASGVVSQTVKISGVVAAVAVAASATPFVGDTIGQLLLYVSLGLLVAGLLFAFKIFMLQLELGLIALLAPLSFAFLGLSTLKDQGIAPFKSLLSFAYRVIILTVILSAFGQINDVLVNTLTGIKASDIVSNGIGEIVDTILAAMGAYLLLAFLVWKSDGVAASMASGSTSLGNSDIASAAAAGAAAGAVVASAGAAAAGGAAQAPQSMANFMSGLNGGGSIKNAGGVGGGGASPAPFVPPSTPSMSRGGLPSASGSTGSSGSSHASGASGTSKSSSAPAASGTPQGARSGSVASGRYGASGAPSSSNSSASSGSPANEAGDRSGVANQSDTETPSFDDALQSTQNVEATNSDSMSGASSDGVVQNNGGAQGLNKNAAVGGSNRSGTSGKAMPKQTTSSAASASNSQAPGAASAADSGQGTGASGRNSSAAASESHTTAASDSEMNISPATAAVGSSNTPSNIAFPTYGATSSQGSTQEAAPHQTSGSAPGSASTAAIGQGDKMQQSLDQIAQSLANQGPKKPTLKDHLGEANRQVERERDATHVHINTHHSD